MRDNTWHEQQKEEEMWSYVAELNRAIGTHNKEDTYSNKNNIS